MRTNKNKKFSLEKFEVVKLKSMKLIKGGIGDTGGVYTDTQTSSNCPNGGSSRICVAGH